MDLTQRVMMYDRPFDHNIMRDSGDIFLGLGPSGPMTQSFVHDPYFGHQINHFKPSFGLENKLW